jgi:CDGSH-type Zn-finger protein
MVEVRMKAVKNGPNLIMVDGNVQLALCRCGHSKNKPMCDGSHRTAEFEAEDKELKVL